MISDCMNCGRRTPIWKGVKTSPKVFFGHLVTIVVCERELSPKYCCRQKSSVMVMRVIGPAFLQFSCLESGSGLVHICFNILA